MVVRSGLRSAVRSAVYSGIADKFGGAFVLSSLWANGEAATLYEADDLTSLFLESDGQTIVTADAQTVGFNLDRAQMGDLSAAAFLSAQPELVSNGSNPTATTGWKCFETSGTLAASNLTASGGVFVVDASSGNRIAATAVTTVVGRTYRLELEVTALGAGNRFWIQRSDVTETNGAAMVGPLSSAQAISLFFVATATTTYIQVHFDNLGVPSGSFNLVSVKSTDGQSSIQTTTSAEPAWKTGDFIRYDGSDDCLLTTAVCGSSGNSLAVKVTLPASAASAQVIAGLQASSSTRFYLAVDTSGNLCAGVGNDGITTIIRTGNLFGETGVAVLVEDGSTVKLFLSNNPLLALKPQGEQSNGRSQTTLAP